MNKSLFASLFVITFAVASFSYAATDDNDDDYVEEKDSGEIALREECKGCQFYSDDAYYFHGRYPSYIEQVEHETVTWPGKRSDPFVN